MVLFSGPLPSWDFVLWGRSADLVTEDLDLAHSPVHQLAAATATVVGVDLQVQGDSLHPLLRGEVRAQAVHPNKHLQMGQGLWVLGTSSPGSAGSRGQGQKRLLRLLAALPGPAWQGADVSHLSLSPHTYSSS